ncbi:elongation factor 4, partial [Streptococcus suis]
ILDAIIDTVPAPQGLVDAPLRGLIFDSIYDEYRGVILFVRVVDGLLSKSDAIELMATRADGLAIDVGIFKPAQTSVPLLETGQIGYVVTNLKSI